MATRITTCPKCDSENIQDINPQVRASSTMPTVLVTAKCLECAEVFNYPAATDAGKRRGILY